MMAQACLVGGFLLAVVGIALLSVPVACIVAGSVLFLAGGLESQRSK